MGLLACRLRAMPLHARFWLGLRNTNRHCGSLGIVIQMYFTDHPPPHFHAIYGGDQALIVIKPIGLHSGSLPPRALALAVEWARLHEAELLENWERLRQGRRTVRIAPLE